MVNLEKSDVVRIVENILRDLSIDVRQTADAGRVLELKYNNQVISYKYLDTGNN